MYTKINYNFLLPVSMKCLTKWNSLTDSSMRHVSGSYVRGKEIENKQFIKKFVISRNYRLFLS